MRHVCLIGDGISQNWSLVERLLRVCRVTLVADITGFDRAMVSVLNVIAIDCGRGNSEAALALIDGLRPMTSVPIVAMDGGLRRAEIARVLNAGAQDYFSEPFNVQLIAERLETLANTDSHPLSERHHG